MNSPPHLPGCRGEFLSTARLEAVQRWSGLFAELRFEISARSYTVRERTLRSALPLVS